MIYSYLHQGSGAGNQLFRMIAARVKALELGVDWRMIWNPDNSGKSVGFKCKDFMQFDESKVVDMNEVRPEFQWNEKKIMDDRGVDIRGFDPEFFFIRDGTLIEGELQDSRYWEHREKEVNEWLKVDAPWGIIEINGIGMVPFIPQDLCVIGFRGGEFALYPDLFLTKDYWEEAIAKMREINPNMKFEVHTDDKPLAEAFFEGMYPVIHDIGINWRSMRYAKYAIIANSSFFILPRWLRQHDRVGAITVSPRFWGRRNTRIWSLPQNYYRCFSYI